jgi:Tfp pilus assembly protein PilX
LPGRNRQSGVSLLIALIALVAMALAGIALIRAVDTNSMIASNMAFRQSTRESADAGIEAARTWLLDKADTAPATLEGNSAGDGYYATNAEINLTGNMGSGKTVSWLNNDRTAAEGGAIAPACLATTDAAGNVVCYVIQRMCDATGAFNADTCDSVIANESSGQSQNSLDLIPSPKGGGQALSAVYRVTVRAAGPRNNLSYVQALIVV